MAEQIEIPGAGGATARIRNIVAVPVLAILTVAIYLFFWWYFINGEMSDYGRAKGTTELGTSPGRSLLAVSLGAFLIVPALWSTVTTFQRVQATQRMAGTTPINGWIGLVLFLVFTPAMWSYMQSGLNSAWRTVAPPTTPA
jgi:Domain of unknown function (DUF4234)